MRTPDFGDLFERYWPDVFRFAVYLTGNRADAEDVASVSNGASARLRNSVATVGCWPGQP